MYDKQTFTEEMKDNFFEKASKICQVWRFDLYIKMQTFVY